MTEKKQLPEQRAFHSYKQPVTTRAAGEQHAMNRREVASDRARSEKVILQRVVTIPESSDPSTAWNMFAQRQAQRRRVRARPEKYTEMVRQRSYVQTGVWAPGGISRTGRRPLAPQASPIPTRSGRQARRRSFVWKILSIFGVSLLMVLATNFAFTSNAFRIEQVSVIGTHNDALTHTIESMGMQGQNIFLLNVESLRERIEALPLVASANFSKQLPNQLTVTIAERTPALLWQTPQGVYSIDNQGVVISSNSEATGADHLGTVIDISNQGNGQSAKGGQQMHSGMHVNSANVVFASTLLDRLPAVIGADTFKLQYNGIIYASTKHEAGTARSGASFIIESQHGWKAFLGDASDTNPLDNRLLELQQILALAQQQQLDIATIDLRYGLRPVYTLNP